MNKITLAALLGATLLTGAAAAAVQTGAQDTPQRRMARDPMTVADADKDGVVTRDEAIAAVTARFARFDGDKDGKITAQERQAARAAMGGRFGMGMRMRSPDGDGDGIVTLDEQRARALKRFDFVDRNGDGKVDRAERDLVREMLRELAGPGRGHHGRHGPHRGGDMPPPSPAPPANGS